MECKEIDPKDIHMTREQALRFWKFINGDDLDFYEEYVIHLPLEEQRKFFEKNPDFMSSFPVSPDRISLLKDYIFRGILRKIKDYEGRRNG